MIKVGLTGGIGSGKSTVANLFRILGVEVYTADTEAKSLMQNNAALKNDIVSLLGNKSYQNGVLNTKYIASFVFSKPDLLEKLNALVHPVVKNDFSEWLEKHEHKPYIIQESALLFESGFSSMFDYSIVVTASMETRIERIILRDNNERADVLARINQQMPDKEKLLLADYQFNNDGEKLLIPQVIEFHNKFVSLQLKMDS